MNKNSQSDSLYYQGPNTNSLVTRVIVHARRKMFRVFMEAFKPGPECRILDLGVTSGEGKAGSNYFEELYPYKDKITCAGIEDATFLEKRFPGIKFVLIKADSPLPFSDGFFDIVISSAVVEHVGNRCKQQQFIQEALRVSKSFFIITPNRWFPIELHTVIPFLHYLPTQIFRSILKMIGLTFWAQEENLNLLSSRDLRRLFPAQANITITHNRLLGFSSNVIAYGKSQ